MMEPYSTRELDQLRRDGWQFACFERLVATVIYLRRVVESDADAAEEAYYKIWPQDREPDRQGSMR